MKLEITIRLRIHLSIVDKESKGDSRLELINLDLLIYFLRKDKFDIRVHWLAEQGLAPKRVFLVVIPILTFIVVELAKKVLDKEDKRMKNKLNTIDVLNASINVISNISGNIAGGALLANAF